MIDDDARKSSGRSDPNTRPCDDCGHVWFAGERRHAFLDPGTERPDGGAVLCALCRHQRGLARLED